MKKMVLSYSLGNMNAIIGLLILCGTYSTHSASVSVPLSAPCSGQEDGVLFRVQGKCSQFYICLNGKEVLQNCGAQLHFDAKNRECIEASKSACIDGQSHVSWEAEIEKKPVELTNICSGKAVGAFLPSKTSCSDFYVCVGNKAMLKSCQEGQHFDADANACIRAEISKCIEKVNKPVEEVKPQLTGPTGTTVFAETVCLGQPNGAKFAAPGSCSKYLTCLQHRAYEKSCGLRHFNPLARSCVDAKTSKCVEGESAIINQAVQTTHVVSGETNLANPTTAADMGPPGKVIVVGGKVIRIKKSGLPVINKSPFDSKIASIKLPVTSQLESDVDNVDIIEITMDVDGGLAASDSGVDIGIVDEKNRAGNTGVFLGSGNIDINNEGSVSNISVTHTKGEKERANNKGVFVGNGNIDINNEGSVSGISVISSKDEKNRENVDINNDGSVSGISVVNAKDEKERANNKGVFVGSGNIDINNEGTVANLSVINGNSVDIPVKNESTESDSSEIVIAVFDEDSAAQCVGIQSGSLLPKRGNCREFLTCEDGVAYVGQCPEGLHYNKALKICDWPELAGCT